MKPAYMDLPDGTRVLVNLKFCFGYHGKIPKVKKQDIIVGVVI